MTRGQGSTDADSGGRSRPETPGKPPSDPATAGSWKASRGLRRSLVVLGLSVALVAGLGAAGLFYVVSLTDRPGPLTAETSVVVARGTPVNAIATQLKDAGVIENAGLFALTVRLFGESQPLRAGEFAFPAGVSVRGSMEVLQSGQPVLRRLTIPEGLTTGQVLALVSATEGLAGPVSEPEGEGRLLPETYYFSLDDSRAEIVDRMQQSLREVLAELWLQRAPDLPFTTPEEALVLASIVEKETGLDDERPLIAAVFINRLRRGMRLQSDPTVAFGLAPPGRPLERALTRADLRADHPYNTYQIDGLPPEPIANAGRASIEAVLNPAESDNLFFVADGSGGHAFAVTLQEHNRNVAKWRRVQRQSSSGN